MHGLNKEFMADPPAFMRKYALDILNPSLTLGGTADQAPLSAGVYKFDLSLGENDRGRAIVGLFGAGGRHSHPIEAHWLPWKSGGTSELTLDNRAKFFFTAALAGCRIQVAGTKVLHIAGDTKLVTKEIPRSWGKPFIQTSSAPLTSSDTDQAAGVAWRTGEAKEHLGAKFDPARKFSASDYGLGGYGFLAGYATHGVWLFVGQTLQEENGKLFVRSCTELVGGEFAIPKTAV